MAMHPGKASCLPLPYSRRCQGAEALPQAQHTRQQPWLNGPTARGTNGHICPARLSMMTKSSPQGLVEPSKGLKPQSRGYCPLSNTGLRPALQVKHTHMHTHIGGAVRLAPKEISSPKVG